MRRVGAMDTRGVDGGSEGAVLVAVHVPRVLWDSGDRLHVEEEV